MYAGATLNSPAFASFKAEISSLILMAVCLLLLLQSRWSEWPSQAVTSVQKINQNEEAQALFQERQKNPNDPMGMQLTLQTNPESRNIEINYCLFNDAGVELSVYDVGGKQVGMLLKAHRLKGIHKHTWNNSQMASGLYFVRLHSPGRQLVKKVLVQ